MKLPMRLLALLIGHMCHNLRWNVHLQGAEHIWLKELLIREGVIDQGTVMNDGVQGLRQFTVHFRIQTQLWL